jgi:hypothetical protein
MRSKPNGSQRLAVALHGELRVGTAAARVLHRAADQHVLRQMVELRVRMAAQLAEEAVEEILEAPGAAEDIRLLEEPARGEALQRLDEAAVAGELDEALDRPRPASDITFGWSSSPSFQKHSAERNENRRFDMKLNTTGSAGAWGCAHESTVLVVPKSSPSESGAAAREVGKAFSGPS